MVETGDGKDGCLPRAKWPLVLVTGVVGLVWLGQGVGLVGGSFMSGDPLWAVIGAALLLVAAVLAVNRGRR